MWSFYLLRKVLPHFSWNICVLHALSPSRRFNVALSRTNEDLVQRVFASQDCSHCFRWDKGRLYFGEVVNWSNFSFELYIRLLLSLWFFYLQLDANFWALVSDRLSKGEISRSFNLNLFNNNLLYIKLLSFISLPHR